VTIGTLGLDDLEAALALSGGEGWNQTAADWSRMIRLEPDGCFAARDGERRIGTVTTTTYGRALAWIGMMIVHPEYRRQGIGAALMGRALDHLHDRGIATVKLDATPAGRPLYESLGFVAEVEMERWQGAAVPRSAPAPADRGQAARRALESLDRAAYGVDRSRLLDLLVTEGVGEPIVEGAESGAPLGYALARRNRTSAYIGPLIATSAEGALRLLDAMLARFAGEDVSLDRHAGGWLAAASLAERGLTLRRGLTRMFHGPRSDIGTARSICAGTGPQFG